MSRKTTPIKGINPRCRTKGKNEGFVLHLVLYPHIYARYTKHAVSRVTGNNAQIMDYAFHIFEQHKNANIYLVLPSSLNSSLYADYARTKIIAIILPVHLANAIAS